MQLTRQAELVKTNKNYRFVWIKNRTVYMRKDDSYVVVKVRSEVDIYSKLFDLPANVRKLRIKTFVLYTPIFFQSADVMGLSQ